MDLVPSALLLPAVVIWALWLRRTLLSGGSGLRPPQPPQRHWSADARPRLPDAPYRSLDRLA
jgi:hypothetical protein